MVGSRKRRSCVCPLSSIYVELMGQGALQSERGSGGEGEIEVGYAR
jgi:hypothetical protein